MGCNLSSSISPSSSSSPLNNNNNNNNNNSIIKKNHSKKRFRGDSKFSISPSVAEVDDMLVDIPDPFKSSYKIIEKIHNKNYKTLYTAFSRDKKEVIVEFTELNLYISCGHTEIDYFTRLDLLRQFEHQSIPKVLDFFDGKETNRIVFEMASGKDLQYLLKAKGPPKYTMIKPFMIALISVVQYLHKQDIMHQNIKPSSIILAAYSSFHRPEQLKLVGFNYLSRSNVSILTPTILQSHTSASSKCCYPIDEFNPYSAPEIKSKNYNSSVDLYSIGAILYTLVTGNPPLATNSSTLQFGREWETSPIRDMGIQSITMSLLSHNPTERPSLISLLTFFDNMRTHN